MKLVYLAGPFRGDNHWVIFQNICRAEALALEVWKLGAACICPHLNTAHFQNALPDSVWLEGDLEMVRRCDALLLTADWKRSSGACAERAFAIAHNILVFYYLSELNFWLQQSAGNSPF